MNRLMLYYIAHVDRPLFFGKVTIIGIIKIINLYRMTQFQQNHQVVELAHIVYNNTNNKD